ncbi:MAG: hypothetical protein LBO20_03410 [Bifidobacteriaceae bacterium]|jgi:very-short-patch-repair endonuclease|nr:hypothetical protein [Bifidobacteriaceae bacterium]
MSQTAAHIVQVKGLPRRQADQLRQRAVRLERGVYLDGDADPGSSAGSGGLVNRVRAGLAVAPAGSVVTGATTFTLAGAPLPDGFAEEAAQRVHLLMPPTTRQGPRRPWIVPHTRSPHCAALLLKSAGLLTTPITHSWVDAVQRLGRDTAWRPWSKEPPGLRGRFDRDAKRVFLEAVQLADALVRRQSPWCALEELADCAAAARGTGSKLVRTAFEQVRARTDSFMETWLRLVLWDAGFPDPTVNHDVWVGRQHYFIDLAWPERMVGLEYQGRHHFDRPDQSYGDSRRRGNLQKAGWTIVEAVYADLLDPADLMARLAPTSNW